MNSVFLKIPTPDLCFRRLLKRVPRYIWITFLSAVALGFLTHLFMLANKLPNHDDIGQLFNATYGTASGRWLLPTVLRLDGDYSMPWLIGSISILMLAVSACFTAAVLRIRSTLGCILTAALMATFPTVAATFSYMFTADAYFVSLALACSAAYMTVRFRWGFLWGIAGVALSMGIYQSYFAVSASLLVAALVFETLDGGKPFRGMLLKSVKYLLTLLAGMVIYIVLVKITTLNIGLVDYMGISEMGRISLSELPGRIVLAYKELFRFFLANSSRTHFACLRYFFMLTCICSIWLVVFILRRKKTPALCTALVAVLMILYPLACNLIYVMASGKAHSLMIYGACFLLIAPISLAEYIIPQIREEPPSLLRSARSLCCWIIMLSMALTSYSYYIHDNKAYLKIHIGYEQTYAYSTRLLSALEQTDGYVPGMPVAMIGYAFDNVNPDPTPQLNEVTLTGIGDMEFFLSSYTYGYMLKYYLGFGENVNLNSSELSKKLAQTEEVSAMPVYPEKGSIRVIDGCAVIKLNH